MRPSYHERISLHGLCLFVMASGAALGCSAEPRQMLPTKEVIPVIPSATTNAPPPAPVEAASASVVPPPGPPPLTTEEPFVRLPVEGYADAIVSIPTDATSRRPVVLATHGNYDRPEWQCEVWREIVETQAFVLCPRGIARDDSPSPSDIRFTYATNEALERETRAALSALARHFPEHVDVEHPLYTGFSLGAIMGVKIAGRDPAGFPRLVLVEGGQDNWTDSIARAFAKGGGGRVVFVCSQPQCGKDADAAARRLKTAGVVARVVRGPSVGHRYDGPIAAAARSTLGWVTEGDSRFGFGQDGEGRLPGN